MEIKPDVLSLKPQSNKNHRLTFSKSVLQKEPPDLLNVQLQSYKDFLQEDVPISKRKSHGLQKVFEDNFPITDSRETAILEFVLYRETALYNSRMPGTRSDIFRTCEGKIASFHKTECRRKRI